MSFPYNANLPNPPDNPSSDVSGMQTNSGTINNWTQVDHIGFNTSTGGQHKQVTFQGSNVPNVPTTPPVLFVNTQDGAGTNLPNSLPELFFYSGSLAQSQSQYNVTATNGSTMLLGGIILKWGFYNSTPAGTVTFTNPFPNAVFCIQLTADNSGSQLNVTGSPNVSSFTFNSAPGGLGRFFWLAIGN